ncbi:MAG: 23S rRNA (uracil(1939)-C(5))-methyltransferase RlmD [Candidatus Zophobacter franzmannii]|nr:23S rRNA (uracil(1939)-C(5))-methyltransferase RlmD [Candidatus Zophobacter franzmannii]
MEHIKELKIEKVVFGGYGLGFHDGHAVFVTNGIPGDVVKVRIKYKKKDSLFGEIDFYIKHSPDYIPPPCEVFNKCGGCSWLNVSYESQLRYKTTILDELMRNLEFPINPVQCSPMISQYRNKSFLPVGGTTDSPKIGMFASQTHTVIEYKDCALHPKLYDRIIEIVKDYIKKAKVPIYDEKTGKGTLRHLGIRYSTRTGELIIILVTKTRKLPFTKQLVNMLSTEFKGLVGIIQNINPSSGNRILGEDDKLIYGEPYITEELMGKSYRIHYKSFFQVNTSQAEEMLKYVKLHINKDDTLIDAYCGTGSIGISLSSSCRKVIGIESVSEAIEDAKQNCSINSVDNCEFICGTVEESLKQVIEANNADVIVFDPPRKGLDPETVKLISDTRIAKIIYISCNPATQLRDLKGFISAGYKLKAMQAFDMFPHTWHIENIAVLEL